MANLEHRTVSRAMAILELVVASESQGLRLADLATLLGAPKSSLHGLARGLVATGHLREADGRYVLGPAMVMLALSGQQVTAAYRESMQTLSDRWGETALLAALIGDAVINLDAVEPDQLVRATPSLHTRRPIWPTSSGKIFLAYMAPERRDALLSAAIADAEQRDTARDELCAVRDRGYSISAGEVHPDLYGVASPIGIAGSDPTLAIAVLGPAFRMRDRMDAIAADVRETATALSGQSASNSEVGA